MITGVAFCPHPPLMVPAIGAGAAAELDPLRSACDAAIGEILATGPQRLVLVGGGAATAPVAGGTAGTLAPYGLDVRVRLGDGPACGAPSLPLSLTIGAWLVGRTPWSGPVAGLTVGVDEGGAAAGSALAEVAGPQRTALLVMADGSSSRTVLAPGSWQPGALAFDAALTAALASGRPDRLAALDGARGQAAGSGGCPAWWAAASVAGPGPWRARVHYDQAPYGVGYVVASWT
jgi:hypothetical protein